jgi:hypothetical protein
MDGNRKVHKRKSVDEEVDVDCFDTRYHSINYAAILALQ